MGAMLLLAAQLGQGAWCYVPPGSEQMFCDHTSLGACRDAHKHEKGGACLPNPRPRQQRS